MYASVPASFALVGRDRELAILRERLAATRAGSGCLVLIGGEAGIGKTALAGELCREAEERGALVLVGPCYDLTETPPYGPWVEFFARYPDDGRLPPLPEAFAVRGTVGAMTSQDALFRQVLTFLTALCARQPLLLLLEDLQWADPASLDLLRFLARSIAALPVLLIVTYRSDELTRHHPLSPLLPLLVSEAGAERVDLRPLEDDAVRALVEGRYRLGGGEADRLVAYLQRRAEGNALFVGEVLRALEEGGALARDGDGWRLGDLTGQAVPTLLRQVIEGRTGRLGEAAVRLLGVAAVIGQEVPLALWERVAEVDEEALLGVIERSVAAHLIAEVPDGMGVRFTHALIREALYEGMPATRRRRLHLRAAEALAAAPGVDPDAVASHFQRAGDGRAVEWLIAAGRRAHKAYALASAAERYEAAIARMEGDPAVARERGWLLRDMGIVCRFWDPRRALDRTIEARRVGLATGDAPLAARALFHEGLIRRTADFGPGLPQMIAAIAEEEAMADGPPGPTGHAPRDETYHLNAGILAVSLAADGRFDEARRRAERTLAALGAPADRRSPSPAPPALPAVAATSQRALGIVHAWQGRPAEARAAFAAQRRCALIRDDRLLSFWSVADVIFHALIPYALDRRAEWEHLLAEVEREQQRAGAELGRVGLSYRPVLRYLDGAWGEVAGGAAAGGTMPPAYRGLIAHARGDDRSARAIARACLPGGPHEAPGERPCWWATAAQRLAAALAIDAGELPAAREWLDAHDRWLAWSGAVRGRAEGQILWGQYYRAAGDAARARRHAEGALAHATAPRQPLALLAAHRLLGELDTAAGRYDDAARHLDASLALADACRAPYERALALLALAELCAAMGEIEQARTLLDEVRTLCAPLGAQPALARADALASRLARASVPAPIYPDGLTAREVEVLRLIAVGKSNRQIAAALFISERTVNRHMTNLYAKIDAHSKADATAYALRHHLA